MSEEFGEQEMEAIHQQVGGWFDEFIKSPQYERLTETQRNEAPEVIRLFVEYSYNYVGVAPAGWGHRQVFVGYGDPFSSLYSLFQRSPHKSVQALT
jgi:hypothetical protein